MARKRRNRSIMNRQFWETSFENTMTFNVYYHRLVELAISSWEYKNLPDTIDPRFMELGLISDGVVVYFHDEVIGDLCLRTMLDGRLDFYGIPIKRRAYAVNGYHKNLDNTNSVLIYNNYLHMPSTTELAMFAKRLAEIENTIGVNIHAQKTPVLITCSEEERLSMRNLYMKYEGNTPFIFASKGLNPEALRVLKTDAPFLADKLYQLKVDTWNEALTYLGITNVAITKRERLITDEVNRSQGGTIASRNSRLESRRDAVEKINKMFDTNIEVSFREDLDTSLPDEPYMTDGDGEQNLRGGENE